MSSGEGNDGGSGDEVRSESAFGFGGGFGSNPVPRLKEIAAKLNEIKAKKTDLAAIEKELNANQRALEQELNSIMEENDLKTLPTEYGVLRRKPRNWAKFPEDGYLKDQAMDYLRRSGLFEDFAYVHSTKMNSWLWQEVEIARKNGRPDPEILKFLEVSEGFVSGLYEK